MKHEIKKDDGVYFLYGAGLRKGIVQRVNKTTITVLCPAAGFFIEFTKRVPFNRIAHIKDEFTVVWEMDVGVEGRYYITHDEFPQHNKFGHAWGQPYVYISK